MLTPALGLYRSPDNHIHKNLFYYLNNSSFDLSKKTLVISKEQWDFNKQKLSKLKNQIIILTTDNNYSCYCNGVNVIYSVQWLIENYSNVLFLDFCYDSLDVVNFCNFIELLDTFDIFESSKIFDCSLDGFVLSSSSEIKSNALSGIDYYTTIYVKK